MAKVTVDMTNVQDGFTLAPLGDFICIVKSVEIKDNNAKDGKNLVWNCTIGIGPHKGELLSSMTSLKPGALWKVREYLQACGVPCPQSKVDIDTDKLVKKIIGFTIKPSTYKKDGETKESRDFKAWKPEKVDGVWSKPASAESAAKDEMDSLDASDPGDNGDEVTDVEI